MMMSANANYTDEAIQPQSEACFDSSEDLLVFIQT